MTGVICRGASGSGRVGSAARQLDAQHRRLPEDWRKRALAFNVLASRERPTSGSLEADREHRGLVLSGTVRGLFLAVVLLPSTWLFAADADSTPTAPDGENLTDERAPVSESELGEAQYYLLPARRYRVMLDWTL